MEPRYHSTIALLVEALIKRFNNDSKRMLRLIIVGTTALLFLITNTAIGSTALAYSVQTAHFADN